MSAPLTIIPAAAEHIPVLCDLLHALDTPQFTYAIAAEVDEWVRDGKYFLALSAGVPAGLIALDLREASCEILTIVSRRPGTGRALVSFARAWAAEHGAKKLWCWSLTRYRAEGFYRAAGFTEEFRLRQHWGGEDCWLFGMPL